MDDRLTVNPAQPSEDKAYLNVNRSMLDTYMPSYQVKSITDADTMVLTDPQGQSVVSRFAGIDAPELSQRGGLKAKAFLEHIVEQEGVNIRAKGVGISRGATSGYSRTMFQHFIETEDNKVYDLNRILVRHGYAHGSFYRDIVGVDQDYKRLEDDARRRRIGLFSDSNNPPQDPYIYRQLRRDPALRDQADYQSTEEQLAEQPYNFPKIDLSKEKPMSKVELNMTMRGFRRQYDLPIQIAKDKPESQQGAPRRIEAMPYYSIKMPSSYFDQYKGDDYMPYISQFEELYEQRTGEELSGLRSWAIRGLDSAVSQPSVGFKINRFLGFEFYKEGQGMIGSTLSSVGRALDNLFGQQEYNEFKHQRTHPDSGSIRRILGLDYRPEVEEGGGGIESLFTTTYEVAKGTAVAIGTYIGLNLPYQHLTANMAQATMDSLIKPTAGRSGFMQGMIKAGQQFALGRSFGSVMNLATSRSNTQGEVASKFNLYMNQISWIQRGKLNVEDLKDDELKALVKSMMTEKGFATLGKSTTTTADGGSIILGQEDELSVFKSISGFRRFDANRYSLLGRPILEAINPYSRSTSEDGRNLSNIYRVALDELEETMKQLPILEYRLEGRDSGMSAKMSFKNTGFDRVKQIAKSLDRVGALLPANMAYWIPGVRQTLKLNDFNPRDNLTWRDLFSIEEATERVSYAMKTVGTSLGLQWQRVSPDFDTSSIGGTVRLRGLELMQTFKHMFTSTKDTIKAAQQVHTAGEKADEATTNLVRALHDALDQGDPLTGPALQSKKVQDLLEEYKNTQVDLELKHGAYKKRTFMKAFQEVINPLEDSSTSKAILHKKFSSLGAGKFVTQKDSASFLRKRSFKRGVAYVGAALLTDAALDFAFMRGGANLFTQLFARQALKDEEGEDIARFRFDDKAPTMMALRVGMLAGAAAGFVAPEYIAPDKLTLQGMLSSQRPTTVKQLKAITEAIGTRKVAQLKFNKTAAWAGAMAGIFATKMAFSAGAGLLNALYGHKAGLELDSEAGIINHLMNKEALKAQDYGVATGLEGNFVTAALLEDIAFGALNQGPKESRMYSLATQFTLPFFQVSALAKLDTQKDTLSFGVGFQLAPVLGLGLSPMLPVSLRLSDREREAFELLEDGETLDMFTSMKYGLKTGADIFLGGQNLVYNADSGFKDALTLIGAGSLLASTFSENNRSMLLRSMPKMMRGGVARELKVFDNAMNSAIPRTIKNLAYNGVRNITTLPLFFGSATYKAAGSKGAPILAGALAVYSLAQAAGEIGDYFLGDDELSDFGATALDLGITAVNVAALGGAAAAFRGGKLAPGMAKVGKAALPFYLGLTAARIISQPGTKFEGYEVESTDEHIEATLGLGLGAGFVLQASGAFASREQLVRKYLQTATQKQIMGLADSVEPLGDLADGFKAQVRPLKLASAPFRGFGLSSMMGMEDIVAGDIYTRMAGEVPGYAGRTPQQVLNAQSFRRLRGRVTMAYTALFGGYIAATAVADLSTEQFRDFIYQVPVIGAALKVISGREPTPIPDDRGPDVGRWLTRAIPGPIKDMLGIYKDNPDPFFQATTLFGQSFKDSGMSTYFQVASSMTDLSASSYAIAVPQVDNTRLMKIVQQSTHKGFLGVYQTYRGQTQRKDPMTVTDIQHSDLKAASSLILRDIRLRQFRQEHMRWQRASELQLDLSQEMYATGMRGSAMLPGGRFNKRYSPLRGLGQGKYILSKFKPRGDGYEPVIDKSGITSIDEYIDQSYYKDRMYYQAFGGADVLSNILGYMTEGNDLLGAGAYLTGVGVFGFAALWTGTQALTTVAEMARTKEAYEVIEQAMTTRDIMSTSRYKYTARKIEGVNRLVQIDLGVKGGKGIISPQIDLDDLAYRATAKAGRQVMAGEIAEGFQRAQNNLIRSVESFFNSDLTGIVNELSEMNLSLDGSTAQIEKFRQTYRKALDTKIRQALKTSLSQKIHNEVDNLILGKSLGFSTIDPDNVDDIVNSLLGSTADDIASGKGTGYVDDLLDDLIDTQQKYSNQFPRADFDPDDFRLRQRVRLGDARFGASTRTLFGRITHPTGDAYSDITSITAKQVRTQTRLEAERLRRAKLYGHGIYKDKAWSEGFLRETGYVAKGTASVLGSWLSIGKPIFEAVEGIAVGLDQSNPELLRREGYSHAIKGTVNTATAMALTGAMTMLGLSALPALAVSVALMFGVDALKQRDPSKQLAEERLYDRLGNFIVDPSGSLKAALGKPGEAIGTLLEYAGAIPAGILSALAKPFSFITRELTAPFIVDQFNQMEKDHYAVSFVKGMLLPATSYTKDWMRRANNAQYVKQELLQASKHDNLPTTVHPFLMGRASSYQEQINNAKYFKSYSAGGRILQSFGLGSYRVSNLMMLELKRRQMMDDIVVTGSMAKRLEEKKANPLAALLTLTGVAAAPIAFNKFTKSKLATELARDTEFLVSRFSGRLAKGIFGNRFSAEREVYNIARRSGLNNLPDIDLDVDSRFSYYSKTRGIRIGRDDADILARMNRGQIPMDDSLADVARFNMLHEIYHAQGLDVQQTSRTMSQMQRQFPGRVEQIKALSKQSVLETVNDLQAQGVTLTKRQIGELFMEEMGANIKANTAMQNGFGRSMRIGWSADVINQVNADYNDVVRSGRGFTEIPGEIDYYYSTQGKTYSGGKVGLRQGAKRYYNKGVKRVLEAPTYRAPAYTEYGQKLADLPSKLKGQWNKAFQTFGEVMNEPIYMKAPENLTGFKAFRRGTEEFLRSIGTFQFGKAIREAGRELPLGAIATGTIGALDTVFGIEAVTGSMSAGMEVAEDYGGGFLNEWAAKEKLSTARQMEMSSLLGTVAGLATGFITSNPLIGLGVGTIATLYGQFDPTYIGLVPAMADRDLRRAENGDYIAPMLSTPSFYARANKNYDAAQAATRAFFAPMIQRIRGTASRALRKTGITAAATAAKNWLLKPQGRVGRLGGIGAAGLVVATLAERSSLKSKWESLPAHVRAMYDNDFDKFYSMQRNDLLNVTSKVSIAAGVARFGKVALETEAAQGFIKNKVKPFLKGAVNTAKGVFTDLGRFMDDTMVFGKVLAQDFKETFPRIGSFFQGAKETLDMGVDIARAGWDGLSTKVRKMFGAADVAEEAVRSPQIRVPQYIQNFMKKAGGMYSRVMSSKCVTAAGEAWNATKGMLKSGATNTIDFMRYVKDQGVKAIGHTYDLIKSPVRDFLLSDGFQAFKQGAKNQVDNIISHLPIKQVKGMVMKTADVLGVAKGQMTTAARQIKADVLNLAGKGVAKYGLRNLLFEALGSALDVIQIGAGVNQMTQLDEYSSKAEYQQAYSNTYAGTGSLLGSAIGSFFGPVGTIVGGVIGGIGGSLYGQYQGYRRYRREQQGASDLDIMLQDAAVIGTAGLGAAAAIKFRKHSPAVARELLEAPGKPKYVPEVIPDPWDTVSKPVPQRGPDIDIPEYRKALPPAREQKLLAAAKTHPDAFSPTKVKTPKKTSFDLTEVIEDAQRKFNVETRVHMKPTQATAYSLKRDRILLSDDIIRNKTNLTRAQAFDVYEEMAHSSFMKGKMQMRNLRDIRGDFRQELMKSAKASTLKYYEESLQSGRTVTRGELGKVMQQEIQAKLAAAEALGDQRLDISQVAQDINTKYASMMRNAAAGTGDIAGRKLFSATGPANQKGANVFKKFLSVFENLEDLQDVELPDAVFAPKGPEKLLTKRNVYKKSTFKLLQQIGAMRGQVFSGFKASPTHWSEQAPTIGRMMDKLIEYRAVAEPGKVDSLAAGRIRASFGDMDMFKAVPSEERLANPLLKEWEKANNVLDPGENLWEALFGDDNQRTMFKRVSYEIDFKDYQSIVEDFHPSVQKQLQGVGRIGDDLEHVISTKNRLRKYEGFSKAIKTIMPSGNEMFDKNFDEALGNFKRLMSGVEGKTALDDDIVKLFEEALPPDIKFDKSEVLEFLKETKLSSVDSDIADPKNVYSLFDSLKGMADRKQFTKTGTLLTKLASSSRDVVRGIDSNLLDEDLMNMVSLNAKQKAIFRRELFISKFGDEVVNTFKSIPAAFDYADQYVRKGIQQVTYPVRNFLHKGSQVMDRLGLGFLKKIPGFIVKHADTGFSVLDITAGIIAEEGGSLGPIQSKGRAVLSRQGKQIVDTHTKEEALKMFEEQRMFEMGSFMGTTMGGATSFLTANPILSLAAGAAFSLWGKFDPTYGGLATKMAQEDYAQAERGEATHLYTPSGGYYARAHHRFKESSAITRALVDEAVGKPIMQVGKRAVELTTMAAQAVAKKVQPMVQPVLRALGTAAFYTQEAIGGALKLGLALTLPIVDIAQKGVKGIADLTMRGLAKVRPVTDKIYQGVSYAASKIYGGAERLVKGAYNLAKQPVSQLIQRIGTGKIAAALGAASIGMGIKGFLMAGKTKEEMAADIRSELEEAGYTAEEIDALMPGLIDDRMRGQQVTKRLFQAGSVISAAGWVGLDPKRRKQIRKFGKYISDDWDASFKLADKDAKWLSKEWRKSFRLDPKDAEWLQDQWSRSFKLDPKDAAWLQDQWDRSFKLDPRDSKWLRKTITERIPRVALQGVGKILDGTMSVLGGVGKWAFGGTMSVLGGVGKILGGTMSLLGRVGKWTFGGAMSLLDKGVSKIKSLPAAVSFRVKDTIEAFQEVDWETFFKEGRQIVDESFADNLDSFRNTKLYRKYRVAKRKVSRFANRMQKGTMHQLGRLKNFAIDSAIAAPERFRSLVNKTKNVYSSTKGFLLEAGQVIAESVADDYDSFKNTKLYKRLAAASEKVKRFMVKEGKWAASGVYNFLADSAQLLPESVRGAYDRFKNIKLYKKVAGAPGSVKRLINRISKDPPNFGKLARDTAGFLMEAGQVISESVDDAYDSFKNTRLYRMLSNTPAGVRSLMTKLGNGFEGASKFARKIPGAVKNTAKFLWKAPGFLANNLVAKPASFLWRNLVARPTTFLYKNLVSKPAKFIQNRIINPTLRTLARTEFGAKMVAQWAKRGSFDLFMDSLGIGVDLYQGIKGAQSVLNLDSESSKAEYTEAFRKMISSRQSLMRGLGGKAVLGDMGELLTSTSYEIANLGMALAGSEHRFERVDDDYIEDRIAAGDTGIDAVMEYGVQRSIRDYRIGKLQALAVKEMGGFTYNRVLKGHTTRAGAYTARARRAERLAKAAADKQAALAIAETAPYNPYLKTMRKEADELIEASARAKALVGKKPNVLSRMIHRLDVAARKASHGAKKEIKEQAQKRLDDLMEFTKKDGVSFVNKASKKVGVDKFLEGAKTKILQGSKTVAKKLRLDVAARKSKTILKIGGKGVMAVGRIAMAVVDPIVGTATSAFAMHKAREAKTAEEFAMAQERVYGSLYGATASQAMTVATGGAQGKAAIAAVGGTIAADIAGTEVGRAQGRSLAAQVERDKASYKAVSTSQMIALGIGLVGGAALAVAAGVLAAPALVAAGIIGLAAIGTAALTTTIAGRLSSKAGRGTRGYEETKNVSMGEVGSVLMNNLRGNARDAWDLVRLSVKGGHKSKTRQERIAARNKSITGDVGKPETQEVEAVVDAPESPKVKDVSTIDHQKSLGTNIKEFFLGKPAYAGGIPDHVKYLKPDIETETKLDVDMRTMEDIEALKKRGEDTDLPWWKRLGNFAKRIFGQATRFAKKQWNRFFGKDSMVRKAFKALRERVAAMTSASSGQQGVDQYAEERKQAQQDRVNIRNALGLKTQPSTTGSGKYDTNKAKFGKNEKIVFDRLVKEGFSKAAIAAIMGHWKQESGFNPHIIEAKDGVKYGTESLQPKLKHGYGLAQWTSYKNVAHSRQAQMPKMTGEVEKDINLQIDFFIKELKGQTKGLAKSSQVWDQLYKAETLDEAMAAMKGYEAYGIAGKRAKMAKEYAQLLDRIEVDDPVQQPSDINSDGSLKLNPKELFDTMTKIYESEKASDLGGTKAFRKLAVYTPFLYDNSPRGSWDYTLGRGSNRKVGIPMPFSGEVISVLNPDQSGGYGWDVLVYDPKTGITHRMAHMSKVMVKAGDKFEKGQVIMNQGTTGSSTGDHVHHEMHSGKITYAQSVGNRPKMIRDRSKSKPILDSMFDFWKKGSDGVVSQQQQQAQVQEDRLKGLEKYMELGQAMTPGFIDIVVKKGGLDEKEKAQLEDQAAKYNSTLSDAQQKRLTDIKAGKVKDPFEEAKEKFRRSVEDIPAATGAIDNVMSDGDAPIGGVGFGAYKIMTPKGNWVQSMGDLTPHWKGTGNYARRRKHKKFKSGVATYIRDSDQMVYDFTLWRGNNQRNLPVPSPVEGVVVAVNHGSKKGVRGGSSIVTIRQPNGKTTKIVHMSGIKVKEGQEVKFGQPIGIQDDIGTPGSNHIHIETQEDVLDRYVTTLRSGYDPEKLRKQKQQQQQKAVSGTPEQLAQVQVSGNAHAIPASTKARHGNWKASKKGDLKKLYIAAGHAVDVRTGTPGALRRQSVDFRGFTRTTESAMAIISQEYLTSYLQSKGYNVEMIAPEKSEIYGGSDANKQMNARKNYYSRIKQYEDANTEIVEIHYDAYTSQGRAGIIPPLDESKNSRLDEALGNRFGKFAQKHRGGLSTTMRGISIIELAPANQNIAQAFEQYLKGNKAPFEKYLRGYAQAFEQSLVESGMKPQLQSSTDVQTQAPPDVVAEADLTVTDVETMIEQKGELVAAMTNYQKVAEKVKEKEDTPKAVTVPSGNDLRTGQEDTIRKPMRDTVASADIEPQVDESTGVKTNVIQLSDPVKYILSSLSVNDTVDHDAVPYNDTIVRT